MAEASRNPKRPRPRITPREAAASVVRRLVEAGHIAYFAGGCVRDRLMGGEPQDYDVATSARPEEVREVFPLARSVGESFGVMLVRIAGYIMEVATFRTDGVYSDLRRPDAVTFSDAEHDAARRDFTINGLFEDPLAGRIIDYVGGQADLEAGLVRAIGDPQARLREDHLRMLRAVRFAARFAFSLEEATADAIRAGAVELTGVSRERIGQEVSRMLADRNRAVAAWEMQYLGLDEPVLDEPNRVTAPTRLGRLPDDVPYPTALAAWLLDRHEDESEDLAAVAQRWGDALMLSNDDRAGVRRSIEVYETMRGPWPSLGVAAQKRLAAGPWFEDGLLILQAIDREAFIAVRRRIVELSKDGLAPPPLIDGSDLLAMGLEPGPLFRTVLEAVYDAQLEGSVADKTAALALARAVAEAC